MSAPASLAHSRPSRAAARLALAATLLLAALLALLGAAPAAAREGSTSTTLAAEERTPTPAELPETPDGYEISAQQALRIADLDPTVSEERAARGAFTASVDVAPGKTWEAGFFDSGNKVVLVVVDGVSGEVRNSFTGAAVAWPMARGRTGQFGHILNAPYVWIPIAVVFFAALLDWRRPLRIVHLDLLVLLSFGISQVFFNLAEIGVSVPLYYPPLVYLLARMLWIGFRGRSDPLRPTASIAVLLTLCVLLFGGRLAMNLADSGVIDVGYAGVIGADRIADAEPIYGEHAFPENNPHGDTYGPANYWAYVPFEQIFPWSGAWDDLLAARAAAICFDLLCVLGLALLGRRLAGNRLALTLVLAWLAYPYSAFVLQSNSNDALPAALVIWSLVLFARPLARGALLALAATAKFAQAALAPLYLAGDAGLLVGWRDRRWRRDRLLFAAALLAVAALMLAHPAIDPGLPTFWERTIGSQAGRVSPFSIWGQTDLEWLHTLVKAGAALLALAVAFVPRRRTPTQIAALGAAVMIAVQLTAEHWFYLYIVWFLPLLLVAIALEPGRRREAPPLSRPAAR